MSDMAAKDDGLRIGSHTFRQPPDRRHRQVRQLRTHERGPGRRAPSASPWPCAANA